MPQRAKTPPPPQDEIFMTIFYPYPQHANMEVEEDVERVARWLGSIVKPAHLNAFYHKPSARNTIIIEVSKTIGDDRRKLLGQHVWKDILLKPSEGEMKHRSGIFYCVFRNIRDVQKEGWKRIDFEDTWFMPRDGRKHTSLYYDQAVWESIVKEDGVFRIPYPLSSRCEVPMEDPTNRGFCRPLPVDLFPIPVLPEMPREIPGTMEWIKVKAVPESTWAKQPSRAIKGKGGTQTTAQPNDQRGRTAAPRNNNVGLPIHPNHSGINHKSPGTLPPNLTTNGKGKGKEKAKPTLDMDELVAHTVAMDLEDEEEDQEYYGAGLENVLASAGIVTSPALHLPDHDPIDHTGVGVHVSGVSIMDVVVEDSLWGDPMEDKNKPKKDGGELLCEYHGKVCSRGICKVYEKQLREQQKKSREEQGPQDRRSGTGGPNHERWGRGGRGVVRGTRGTLLRGRGAFERNPGPRSPSDENQAPKFKANGVAPPRNAWSKPSGNAGGNTTWGANNNAWSPSEMAESLKSPKDDGTPWNAPGAKDWSQSELGGGSQGDPLSGPGDGGNRPNGKKPGWGETRNPDSGGRGTPPKPQAKPTWGATGAAKDWSPSELALSDSASQCGGGSRIPPGTGPVKKSWADQVEDEFGYADGDEPAPMVAPAPDLEGDGDGDENGWTESNRGKGRGRGKGKGKRRA